MKNYIEFTKWYKNFKIMRLIKKTESIGNNPNSFIAHIDTMLDDCKIFRVDDNTKRMLLMTKVPKLNSHLKLPFPYIFIDVKFTKEDIDLFIGQKQKEKLGIRKVGIKEVIGIGLSRGQLLSSVDDKIVGDNLRMTSCCLKDEGMIWFDTFNEDINITDSSIKGYNMKMTTHNPFVKKMVYCFTLAFLNFLHNPEIEIVEVEHTDSQNLKRIKRGKIPIPSSYSIRLTGKLKKYVSELEKFGHFGTHFSYKFWIRGHFRTLRSERYKKNIGKRVWLAPFVKGSGILIDKEYFIEKKNEQNPTST